MNIGYFGDAGGPILGQPVVNTGADQQPAADAAWPEHLRRVFNEKRELDERISKLGAFFGTEAFGSVAPAEQSRLQKQVLAMQTYSDILKERLAAFVPI